MLVCCEEVKSCFKACTESQIFSWHFPQRLPVRLQTQHFMLMTCLARDRSKTGTNKNNTNNSGWKRASILIVDANRDDHFDWHHDLRAFGNKCRRWSWCAGKKTTWLQLWNSYITSCILHVLPKCHPLCGRCRSLSVIMNTWAPDNLHLLLHMWKANTRKGLEIGYGYFPEFMSENMKQW